MSATKPTFQLRQEFEPTIENNTATNDVSMEISMDKSLGGINPVEKYNNTKLLTENNTYIVKKLATHLPVSSRTTHNSVSFNGVIDTSSSRALINDIDNVYVWDYTSIQKNAPFVKIPLHDENEPALKKPPICLITRSTTIDDLTNQSGPKFTDMQASDNTTSCGICIIEKDTGKITYYEDIESINNLYSQLSKAMSHTLDLNLKDKNEYITEILNIEPAGIVVATSLGALYFITIRDSIGRPHIELKQLIIKAHRGLFSFLGPSSVSSTTSSYSIISIKKGPIVGKGERLLYVTTKSGDFQIWQLSSSSKSFKRVNINVFNSILESLQELYPFAYGSLRLVDSHPLFYNDINVHLFLSTITDGTEMYYILSTIIMDEKTNSYTIFSTYRLNTVVSPILPGQSLPKLLVPNSLKDKIKPVTSVFVLFENAVVITQISSKLDSSFTLRRKWEDIISFREDIKLIGNGYSSDGLYIMSREISGIIKIELQNSDVTDLNNHLEETRFVKSHVDQAVYFSNASLNNPIEFNLPNEIIIDTEIIETDLILSSDEIFHSTSKFIPLSSTNLEQHLNSRINYFKNLLTYIELNFNNNVSPAVKLQIIENFETMNCCLRLLQIISTSDNISEKFRDCWMSVLKKKNLTLDDLVIHKLDKFPFIFTEFLETLSNTSESIEFKSKLINLLISCFYEAILEDGEKAIRYDILNLDPLEMHEDCLPWFINYPILKFLNSLFFDYKFSMKVDYHIDTTTKEQFLTLLKILYYFFNQIKLWISQTDINELDDELKKLNVLYEENHVDWNLVLCDLNYKEQSIQISDFYQDLESLVATLETLKGQDELYEQFFVKFDFSFASTLFEHYVRENKLSDLFYRFPDQHDQLVKFFKENPDKHRDISWIQEIFDGNYEKASKTLSSINLIGNSIETNQLHLNIAKLSGLVEEDKMNTEYLSKIQSKLDILDGEIDLINKLRDNTVTFDKRYQNTIFQTIFETITSDFTANNSTIPFNEIIEIYSLLSDDESFFCALKLLSFNGELIEYEVKKFLVTNLWRRLLLSDKYIMGQETDMEESMLYSVLQNYFTQDLFYSDIFLPSATRAIDMTSITDEYLTNMFSKFTTDGNISEIKACLEDDMHELISLANNLETRIHSVVSAANEITGNKCAINYDSNIIEFN